MGGSGFDAGNVPAEVRRDALLHAVPIHRAAPSGVGALLDVKLGGSEAVPFPLLLRYPGTGTTWVRTEAGDWVIVDDRTLRSELKRQWPAVQLSRRADDGKVVSCTPAWLCESYGRRVDAVIYDLTVDRSEYVPNSDDLGGVLLLRCARLDPMVRPERDPKVEAWLARLGGPDLERLLDWLSTMHRLDRPTAALYLLGPPGAGKGLLAAALARLWGRQVTAYSTVCGRFNSAMRDCPVIFLDEGAAVDPWGSARFRSLVSEREHGIEDKGRPASTLRGCVRLVIAANNVDALRIREDLTRDDEAAIGVRILLIRIAAGDASAGPGAFLRANEHANWVEDEQRRPGALVRHIAWLQRTRKVACGSRFLVEGDAKAWMAGSAQRGGLQQEILTAIARSGQLHGSLTKASAARPVWFCDGVAYVNADRLHRCWTQIMPGGKGPPTVQAVGRALKLLAPVESRLSFDKSAARVRVRAVPAELVIDAADLVGIDLDVDWHSGRAS